MAKRDFTINAMALPLDGGELVDPFGGRADLESGVLRIVSESVFDDDPLRLLRLARLAHELDFEIDEPHCRPGARAGGAGRRSRR